MPCLNTFLLNAHGPPLVVRLPPDAEPALRRDPERPVDLRRRRARRLLAPRAPGDPCRPRHRAGARGGSIAATRATRGAREGGMKRLIGCLFLAMSAGQAALAEDWPEWRGRGRGGVWSESGIL